MKKVILLAIVSFIAATNAQAQFWVEAGLKGLVGTTLPYNGNNFSDDGAAIKLQADYAYGAKLAFNFGDNNGIIVDGMMSQTKANYTYDVLGLVEGEHKLAWKNIDIYPMYRHYYERSFIEIGPKISLLNSVTENGVKDVKSSFNATNYGASLGFGGYLFGSEFFSVSMNFRIDYQITDFISDSGQAAGYPLYQRTYPSYKPTNPITARAGIELAFPIGGVAKAQCGRRVFFMGGNR
jgi:hypothetical protein